jgi:hypothetical protein
MSDVQVSTPIHNAKRILHIQVANEPNTESLTRIAEGFAAALRNNDPTVSVATGDHVQCYNIIVTNDDPISFINVQGTINIETIAKVAHEVNQSYLKALGHDVVAWAEASDAQKQSMTNGVIFKLRNPTSTAEQQHAAWMAAKQAEGWTYGKVKDEEAKTNPAMLPYEALPQEQRVKDFLFHGVVMSLFEKLPHPSPNLQPIEIWTGNNLDFVPGEFLALKIGDVFRFVGKDELNQAQSIPYVNYTDNNGTRASWSIEAVPVELANESPAEAVTDVEFTEEPAEPLDVRIAEEEAEANLKPWVAEDGVIKQPTAVVERDPDWGDAE